MLKFKYKVIGVLVIALVLLVHYQSKAQSVVQTDTIKALSGEKVTVLYGEQTYDRFVGNMNSVKGKDLETYPTMMVREALAGKLPGVFILQNNGIPGGENFTTYIRGNTGGYIILVDGVERPLTNMDIEQIDEIKVLKDALSKALYGGRVSNGVILVTTKRGKIGKNEFHANVQRGVKLPTKLPEYLNSYDFATNYNKAIANDNKGSIPTGLGYSQEALDAYQNHLKPYQYPDVDYYGEFLNKSMDITRVNTEYFSGTDKTRYYFHAGYQNEGGLEKYGDYSRRASSLNLRGNLDAEFSKEIKVIANFWGYLGKKQYANSFDFSTLSKRYPNAYPIFVAPDSVGGTSSWKDNPYGGQAQSGYLKENHLNIQADLGFEFKLDKILKGLVIKPYLTFDIYHKQNFTKANTVGIYQITQFDSFGNPQKIQELQNEVIATGQSLGDYDYERRWAFNGIASWAGSFGNHKIDADLIYYRTKVIVTGTFDDYKRENLGMRTNYSYAGKYNLEGVLNYCGSQSYAPENKYKVFPAIGLGWVVSKEDFLKDFAAINFLRINATWGVMGNGNIGQRLWQEQWAAQATIGSLFSTGNTADVGYYSRVGNNNLNWPTQSEVDVNIEARIFKNVGWKVSYFNYLSSGSLSQRGNFTPSILGGTNFLPQVNFSKTGLQGFEAELGYSGKSKNWSYEISTNITYGKSKKIEVDELTDPLYSTKGNATDDILGYMAIGYYTQADIDAGTSAKPSYMDPADLRVGNIKYEDINADGIINKYDKVVIGNSSPRLMYVANMKIGYNNFELYASFLGYGNNNDLLSSSEVYHAYQYRKYSNVVIDGLPNGNAHPQLTTGVPENDTQQSSYWIANMAFLKLQNVSLSYSLPQNFVKRIKLSDVKLLLYGTDLLTFSKIKQSDPESLAAGVSQYPLFSTYAAGLSISF